MLSLISWKNREILTCWTSCEVIAWLVGAHTHTRAHTHTLACSSSHNYFDMGQLISLLMIVNGFSDTCSLGLCLSISLCLCFCLGLCLRLPATAPAPTPAWTAMFLPLNVPQLRKSVVTRQRLFAAAATQPRSCHLPQLPQPQVAPTIDAHLLHMLLLSGSN